MNDNLFLPDAIDTARDAETGEIRLTFSSDSGQSAAVLLDQTRLLTLVAKLQGSIATQTITPISLGDLREGQTVQTESVRCRRNADGSLHLTLWLRVQGRLVTLPVDLDAAASADLERIIRND